MNFWLCGYRRLLEVQRPNSQRCMFPSSHLRVITMTDLFGNYYGLTALPFANRSHEFWPSWTRKHAKTCASTTKTRNTFPLTSERRRHGQSDGEWQRWVSLPIHLALHELTLFVAHSTSHRWKPSGKRRKIATSRSENMPSRHDEWACWSSS